MGRITTGIGLISGINTSSIIDQLMAIESRPKTLLQNRITLAAQVKVAWADLSTRLSSLNLSAAVLQRPTSFQQASASSSNEDVLSATASESAAPGTYQFTVARLVTSQQAISNGFASSDATVGAGTVTVELGGGELNTQTGLNQLNGGSGVRRGAFRITDRSGRSGIIDISTAMTVDDVLQKINTNLDVSVRAEVQGDRIVLKDQTGLTSGSFMVTDMGDGHAAEDLGIEGTGTNDTLTGNIVNALGRGTSLSQLNDGRGVRSPGGQADMQITAADGSTFDITVGGLNTVGAVLDAINTATGGKVTATTSGKGIVLTDSTGGGGTLGVTALNGSKAASDLGLDSAASGNTIQGRTLLASIDSVLLGSLRGGTGIDLGQISLTDRAGHAATVDLAGAQSMQDIIDRINANGTAGITAKLKDSGNGIQLIDNSNGSGSMVIADVNSTSAAELGIAGTFATSTLDGANMQRQWVSENTLLSAYNGGKGVTLGQFKITNANGESAAIDLSSGNVLDIGDVIKKINSAMVSDGAGGSKSLGVTASINANGDGLLLTDTTGGTAQKLTVSENGGTTAADLNIKGAAGDTTINGTFERTYTFNSADTLQSVADALNATGWGVSAQIVSDGSDTPFRLSLTARNSGRAGRAVFDAGATSLATQNLVEAQDALVFFGGNTAKNPLVISSSTNKITNLVKGVTLDLHAASNSPVYVNVTRTADNIVSELNKFVDNYNGLIDRIGDLTKYDSTTNTKGILLGEGTVQSIQSEMQNMLYSLVSGAGQYKRFTDIGLSASGSNGHLELDEQRFNDAFSANPEAVKKLFTVNVAGTTTPAHDGIPATTTRAQKGLGWLIGDHLNTLIDPVNGLITLENKTIDDRTADFQKRMTQLDDQLAAKRTRLETQFANMETVLARLQSQQSALAGLTSISYSTSSSSTSAA